MRSRSSSASPRAVAEPIRKVRTFKVGFGPSRFFFLGGEFPPSKKEFPEFLDPRFSIAWIPTALNIDTNEGCGKLFLVQISS